eukprot:17155-Heterococcus_DN1.PRE.3
MTPSASSETLAVVRMCSSLQVDRQHAAEQEQAVGTTASYKVALSRFIGAGHHPTAAQWNSLHLVGCEAVPYDQLAVLQRQRGQMCNGHAQENSRGACGDTCQRLGGGRRCSFKTKPENTTTSALASDACICSS